MANSPSSANSLMMDLSDLEHSLNDEVSTVKDWLRRVKSDCDKLRRDKTSLGQQLAAKKEGRNADRNQLHVEISLLKANNEDAMTNLMDEIKSRDAKNAEDEACKE